MRKIKSKKTRIIFAIIIVFLLYNLVWFAYIYYPCRIYAKGMEKLDMCTYVYNENDKYSYTVSTPTYLHFNDASLAVCELKTRNFLVIWPEGGRKFSYGINIEQKEDVYQIEMKNSSTSKKRKYQKIIDDNQEVIQELYKKANSRWNLNAK